MADATNELIIPSEHSTLEHPNAIAKVARILQLYAKAWKWPAHGVRAV
jgi:hypothetical protein